MSSWKRFCYTLCLSCSISSIGLAESGARPENFSTPRGITLAQVYNGADKYLWTRLGNTEGRTLFVPDLETQQASCFTGGECDNKFIPMLAQSESEKMPGWELIEREDGSQQWAYKNKPLYLFSGQTKINEYVDYQIAIQSYNPDNVLSVPPKTPGTPLPNGWQIARFDIPKFKTPSTIKVQELSVSSLIGLVSWEGKTLYTFDGEFKEAEGICKHGCDDHWLPLIAPELALPFSVFSLVDREDGSRQWAYRGAPLFTYSGDVEAGDINGVSNQKNAIDPRWYVPSVIHHFQPKDVLIQSDVVLGNILITSQGLPLYSRHTHRLNYLPRQQVVHPYARGRELGFKGCHSECEKIWQPFFATPSAEGRGYWEIITRTDGKRQWAYKGYLQYININDQPFGQALSNNVYNYVIDQDSKYNVDDIRPTIDNVHGSRALVWRATSP